MPSLFCEDHGEDKLQEAIAEKGKYPGEYTKIVTGELTRGGLVCDKCNRPLGRGDKGYFCSYLSESTHDLRQEEDFFDMKKVLIQKH